MLEKDVLKKQLAETALLSVYSYIYKPKKVIPRAEQNKVLVNFLKKATKMDKYRSVKKDASIMLNVARKNGDAVNEITKYYESLASDQDRTGKNDLDRLYSLLRSLELVGWRSMIFDKGDNDPATSDIMFVLKDHIDHCFTDDGFQQAPLSLLVKTSKFKVLWRLLETACEFDCEIKEQNESLNNYHILVHPKNRKPE